MVSLCAMEVGHSMLNGDSKNEKMKEKTEMEVRGRELTRNAVLSTIPL